MLRQVTLTIVCIFNWTTREINEFVADFVSSHKDYIVRIFKNYRTF